MTRPRARPLARTSRSESTVIGNAPQTTAQGVKIDQRKVPPTASAASSGQIDGPARSLAQVRPGLGHRRDQELADIDPKPRGNRAAHSRSAQSGSAWVTTGMREKL